MNTGQARALLALIADLYMIINQPPPQDNGVSNSEVGDTPQDNVPNREVQFEVEN